MVLGISPGTRKIGIARYKASTLVSAELLSFPDTWSDTKREKIIQTIEQLIHKHGIKHVAIKIPDELPISHAYIQLVAALNVLCEQNNITPQYYTLTELKEGYFPDTQVTKRVLIHYLTAYYPYLQLYARKKNKQYYDKVYEAVGVARLTYLYLNLPE